MLSAADIQLMSVTERFQALEMIWDSLSKSPDQLASPAWHDKILKGRLAEVEAGKGVFLSLSQLKERLGRAGT
ncbi:MAG: addiction module protein [Prosthecobacter sp.]